MGPSEREQLFPEAGNSLANSIPESVRVKGPGWGAGKGGLLLHLAALGRTVGV